ncbi:MAG: UDP-N-acetylmuramoyl-L-alanyl-D-glutamate--2,6-diaminopimelate ligase [Clostridia bacterium]|nr:UDP-N-acetylmuramoyl-L-alanyl-D-glutamate--2,6-diaminopimelate ligase [Clostridia bacterium]
MRIIDLVRDLPFACEIYGNPETEINELTADSRTKSAGGLFFCVPGLHTDAHDFAPAAVSNGAVALVVERRLDTEAAQIKVDSVRRAMSHIAAAFYGFPARKLKMIGITGTKGKTTTSFMLRSILQEAGHPTGLIGTVCTMIGDKEYEAGKTTPDPIEFQRILLEMVRAGMEYVIMEVSAHALDMYRIDGVRFLTAGFTNLSQDHLDYFGTMEKYLAAKLKIAAMTDSLVVNVDDLTVVKGLKDMGALFTRAGIREPADVYANQVEMTKAGVDFLLSFHKRATETVHLRLSGIFNVYNALMAAALADKAGMSMGSIKKGLEALKNVPGRVELLDTNTPYRVILDYAHSPDALENVLKSLRESTRGKLIALFGCGGGRDALKRPIMGAIGGKYADFCIITSDNPRGEEPMDIIDAIEAGIKPVTDQYIVIENRREAIRYALENALEGDTVVLAGKGHETYQEIKGVKHPFDEKEIVTELLNEM